VYHPPILTVLIGVLAITFLAVGAYAVRQSWSEPSPGRPPRPWIVAVTSVLLGLPWYSLMALVFGPALKPPLLVPVVMATAWAAAVFFLIKHWSLTSEWRDMHRWALCFGALLVCMLGGFLGANSWSLMDIVAKAVLNVIGIVCMIRLAVRIARRSVA
jgi:Na+/H+ antiporter NhaD/arsenite permease-like protein